jgi:hypothetical protein
MEKKPTYDLDSFKSEFCSVERLRMTGTVGTRLSLSGSCCRTWWM